jgi:hypothetical protein
LYLLLTLSVKVQIGRDRASGQAVDRDFPAAQFLREHTGKSLDRGLGAAVDRMSWHGSSTPICRLIPSSAADHAEARRHSASAPISWVRLLKRVFEIDMDHRRHRASHKL